MYAGSPTQIHLSTEQFRIMTVSPSVHHTSSAPPSSLTTVWLRCSYRRFPKRAPTTHRSTVRSSSHSMRRSRWKRVSRLLWATSNSLPRLQARLWCLNIRTSHTPPTTSSPFPPAAWWTSLTMPWARPSPSTSPPRPARQ